VLQAAQHQLKTQLSQFFNDPIGQWLIKKHDRECNEYELLVDEHDEIKIKIIDRTFCENGVRWIVDFKTGLDDEETETHHRQQVDSYARLFANDEQESIRCGLYYLASNRWLAWEYIYPSDLMILDLC
jgi:ATP-dependent helicase/nuclease subunit A